MLLFFGSVVICRGNGGTAFNVVVAVAFALHRWRGLCRYLVTAGLQGVHSVGTVRL